MRSIYLLAVLQLCAFKVIAQWKPITNSIRVGVDVMPVDGLTTPGVRYQARYAKHLLNDRLLVGASVGYLRSNAKQEIRDGIYVSGSLRRRIMGDISILYDVLPSAKQALRIGGGPSYISRHDNRLQSIGYSIQDGNAYRIRVERGDYTGDFFGYHLMVEYERSFTNNLAFSGRIGWTDAKRDFPIVLAGFGVSYLLH
jgi:hypothetical protein